MWWLLEKLIVLSLGLFFVDLPLLYFKVESSLIVYTNLLTVWCTTILLVSFGIQSVPFNPIRHIENAKLYICNAANEETFYFRLRLYKLDALLKFQIIAIVYGCFVVSLSYLLGLDLTVLAIVQVPTILILGRLIVREWHTRLALDY